MEFFIEFYKTHGGKEVVWESIFEQEKEDQAIILATLEQMRTRIDYLKKIGVSRSLKGYQGLFELRIDLVNKSYRIFYTFKKGKVIILLHAIVKKSQKTSHKELEIAYRRLKEVTNG